MARKLLLINRHPTQNKPDPIVTSCAIKFVACEKRVHMLLLVLPLMVLVCPGPACTTCLRRAPVVFCCPISRASYARRAPLRSPSPLRVGLAPTPPEPGVCLGGLRVTVSIDGAGASPVNLTLALSNYSGVAGQVQEEYSVTEGRHPCPPE